jgi:hypothetical protein
VLLERPAVTPEELHAATGWEIKPEGACKGDVCVPLGGLATAADGTIDVAAFAERMAMPVAHDEKHGLWSLGPQSGGRVLDSAVFPELVLQDFDGGAFDFATLRGRKTLLIAWASY